MMERLLQQITKANYKLQLFASECGIGNFCLLNYLYYCYSDPKIPAEFQETKTINFYPVKIAYLKPVIEAIKKPENSI